jgi:flagellar protein FliS
MRLVDIVGEMLVAVRGPESPLNDRLAKLYWFLFQRVSEAKINSDHRKLAEALQLLEYERETWQLVCDKAGQPNPASATRSASAPRLSLEA